MRIENKYPSWLISEGENFDMTVTITCREIDRGGQLGKSSVYGSIVKINDLETVITVTDRKHPNCESSLGYILLEHHRQMQLGTFGKVNAPHRSGADSLLLPLHRIGEWTSHEQVKDYKQIPVFFKDEQIWDYRRASDNTLYQVFRKYEGSYYVTKVVRTLHCFDHPLREDVPEGNVIKRKEVVEYTSAIAEPFDFEKEIPRLFS